MGGVQALPQSVGNGAVRSRSRRRGFRELALGLARVMLLAHTLLRTPPLTPPRTRTEFGRSLLRLSIVHARICLLARVAALAALNIPIRAIGHAIDRAVLSTLWSGEAAHR